MADFKTHITVSTALGVAYGAGAYYGYHMPWPTCVLAGGLCSVSGMLPDLDSGSGRPLRESTAFAASVVPMLLLPRLERLHIPTELMVVFAAAVYLLIRFGVSRLLEWYTVHRGMFHSLPAAVIAAEIAYLVSANHEQNLRIFKAGGVLAGFLSHLVLDEIWSVNVSYGVPSLKKSFGTALKLWGDDAWGNLSCYGKLALFSWLTFVQPKLLSDVAQNVFGPGNESYVWEERLAERLARLDEEPQAFGRQREPDLPSENESFVGGLLRGLLSGGNDQAHHPAWDDDPRTAPTNPRDGWSQEPRSRTSTRRQAGDDRVDDAGWYPVEPRQPLRKPSLTNRGRTYADEVDDTEERALTPGEQGTRLRRNPTERFVPNDHNLRPRGSTPGSRDSTTDRSLEPRRSRVSSTENWDEAETPSQRRFDDRALENRRFDDRTFDNRTFDDRTFDNRDAAPRQPRRAADRHSENDRWLEDRAVESDRAPLDSRTRAPTMRRSVEDDRDAEWRTPERSPSRSSSRSSSGAPAGDFRSRTRTSAVADEERDRGATRRRELERGPESPAAGDALDTWDDRLDVNDRPIDDRAATRQATRPRSGTERVAEPEVSTRPRRAAAPR